MTLFETGKQEIRPAAGDTFSVAITGDASLWQSSATADVQAGGSDKIFHDIMPFLSSADLRLIQWEMVLGENLDPILKSGPNVSAPTDCAAFATAGGFDVALLANNHIGDYGPKATLDTRDVLRGKGLLTVGADEDVEKSSRVLEFDCGGFRVGILNVAESEFGMAGKHKAGAAPLDPVANVEALQDASSRCDCVLAVIHGGVEFYPFPTPRQVKLYRQFARAGASAVINIHPHIPQGIEICEGVPIVYSPGNFFFPNKEHDPSDTWFLGYLPKISFDRDGAVGIEILPYQILPEPWHIERLSGELLAGCYRHLAAISEVIADPDEIQALYDAWCAGQGVKVIKWICSGEIPWPSELDDPAKLTQELVAVRCLLTGAAHHELISNAMRLVETARVDQARQNQGRLEKYRFPDFLKG